MTWCDYLLRLLVGVVAAVVGSGTSRRHLWRGKPKRRPPYHLAVDAFPRRKRIALAVVDEVGVVGVPSLSDRPPPSPWAFST